MSAPSIERINVNFPTPVLEDLRRLVPAKRRSEVIARATARELRRLKLAAQFEQAKQRPLWSAEAYPLLTDGAAIDAAIARLRATGILTPTPIENRLATTTGENKSTRRKARRE